MTPIDRTIQFFGSGQALADELGLTRAAVSKWRTHPVPPERCVDIEIATGGLVTRLILRPDVFGPIETIRQARRR